MSFVKFAAFERLFDRSVSVFIVAMGLVVAGATAVVGA